MDTAPWLDEKQQRLWRRWLTVNALLPAALHRDLQADAGLSLPDYEVLVHLTESPSGRVRISDMAQALTWEKSRASHHLTRMEGRGLVRREECPEDGRGAFVVLTYQGRTAIERAAPGHVRAVRSLLFDRISEDELDAMDAVLGKVLEALNREAAAPGGGARRASRFR